MNAVQRFFRRYILSTVGIVLLFFAVNIALLFVIIIAGGMSGADTSFSVRDFSDHVVLHVPEGAAGSPPFYGVFQDAGLASVVWPMRRGW